MRCLSLWQPWASLVVAGLKRVETRSWQTPYRGRLLIHASKKWSDDLSEMCQTRPFIDATHSPAWRGRHCIDFPRGCLLGSVDLARCVRTEDVHVAASGSSPDMPPMEITLGDVRTMLRIGEWERAFGDYRPARFAWLLRDPRPFDRPIPYRGAMGLFDVPAATVAGEVAGAETA